MASLLQHWVKFEDERYKMFGNPYQVRVNNKEELITEILKNNGLNNCYLSICDYAPDGLWVRTIPFDFDSRDEKTKEDIVKLINYFEDEDLLPYFVVDSGNGFHVHLLIRPQKLSPLTIDYYQNKCMIDNNIKTMDRKVFGQPNRMMRIPFTVNPSANTEARIIYESEWKAVYLKLKVPHEVKEREKMLANMAKSYSNGNSVGGLISYSCITSAVRLSNPDHYTRLLFVILRKEQGRTVDEVMDEIRSFKWIDFNERVSRYQVESIYKMKTYMPSCLKLREMGLCSDNCVHRRMIKK